MHVLNNRFNFLHLLFLFIFTTHLCTSLNSSHFRRWDVDHGTVTIFNFYISEPNGEPNGFKLLLSWSSGHHLSHIAEPISMDSLKWNEKNKTRSNKKNNKKQHAFLIHPCNVLFPPCLEKFTTSRCVEFLFLSSAIVGCRGQIKGGAPVPSEWMSCWLEYQPHFHSH